jgi:tetratricopeptide (TPR) repeat protein
MTTLSRRRRVSLAVIALAASAVLFRGNIASALVTRGDDLAAGGDVDGALRMYERAIRIDRSAAAAADRLAFTLLLRRRPGDAARAYAVAAAGAQAAPRDPALLADRGFAAQRLHRWRDAERAFLAAARFARDPRFAHLAAQTAARAGDRAAERAHLETALALDPHYAPARALLTRLAR